MKKKKVTLNLDESIYSAFQKFCEERAFIVSKKVELLLKQELKNSKKLSIFFIFILSLFMMQGVFGAEILFDGFEGGTLGDWTLTHTGSANDWTATTTNPHSGTYSAESNPVDAGETSAMERIISTLGYNNITFSYQRQLVGIDTVDWFRAKWYDGSTWHTVEEQNSEDGDYVSKSFSLTSLANNNANFQVKFECVAGAVSEYCRVDNVNISGFVIDNTPPSFSSYTEAPSNNSDYYYGQFYGFNVTITEENMAEAGIEFGGVNYSVSNISDVYTFNISNLAAGTYSYYWWANDTNGNYNVSGVRYYTVAKGSTTTSVLTSPLSPIIYGNYSNFSCSNSQNLSTTLYINGADRDSQKGLNVLRGAGQYNVTCSSIGNQNYSGSSEQISYTINQAVGQVSLLLNGLGDNLTVQYPQQVNASSSTLYGTITLFRSGQDVSSEDGNNKTLGVKVYNYTAVSSGNQNYSSASIELWVNVTKGIPSVTLLLNGVSDNITLMYLQNLNASAYSNDGTINLYRDNNLVNPENSQNKILGAGYYAYKANVTGDENHTDSDGVTFFINLTKAAPNNMQIVLTPSSTVGYGNQTSATASETNTGDADLTYNLFRDGVGVANPNVVTLNAGVYDYVYNTSGGENYTSGSVNTTLTVNQLNNAVSLLINGIAGNQTINSSETVNASAFSESGTIALFRNGTSVNSENSVNIMLGAGYYEYFANSSGSTNYKKNETGLTFYVNVTPVPDNEPPVLSLNYPANKSYIPETEVYFNYSVTDQYLDSCELWLMQNGSWELNQTDTPKNGDNYFVLNLGEGNYSWGILCNDTANRQTGMNYTFILDSTSPSLILSQPTGKKTSKNVAASWTVSDKSSIDCWYSVYKGASLEVANTTVNCSPSTTSFSVSSDGFYVFNFYVNDSAGNMNYSNLSFTVDTYVAPPPSDGGGGGGGGGGMPLIYKLDAENISNIVADPGDSKRMVLGVKNSGTLFLNECKLKSTGENSGWISSSAIKGLGAGEEYEFVFELKIPDSLEAGSYKLIPAVICREINTSISFNVEILERRLKVGLVTLEKRKYNEVLVIYNIEELSDVSQQVEVAVSLVNEEGKTEAEFKDSKTINAGSKQQFEAILKSMNLFEGNYNLIINAKSPTSSAFLQEEIVLGNPNIQGLAILDESRKNVIITVVLLSVFAVFAGFILMRILKFRGFKKRTNIKSVSF